MASTNGAGVEKKRAPLIAGQRRHFVIEARM
jgi:hypothetical protein